MIEPSVAGLPQPHSVDCWMPSTVSAMPTTISTAPRTSSLDGCLMSFIRAPRNSQSESSATGTLIQKIARQVQNWVR